MMLGAAGLATTGLIPLACTYATFATMRGCEQIRSFICYPKLNVKIIASHGGLEVGWDGPTHQGTEDIAIMRSLPNMTVVVPADAVAVPALLRQIVALDGPVYFRMGRNPVPVIYDPAQEFTLGRAITLRAGRRRDDHRDRRDGGAGVGRSRRAGGREASRRACWICTRSSRWTARRFNEQASRNRRHRHGRGSQHHRRAGRRSGGVPG